MRAWVHLARGRRAGRSVVVHAGRRARGRMRLHPKWRDGQQKGAALDMMYLYLLLLLLYIFMCIP